MIMDTENYIRKANRQLSDKNNYKILQTNLTLQKHKMVNDTLARFKNENLLSKKTAEVLKVINTKTTKFYITHKINNFKVPGNSFLVTMDVKALYTNIPNNESIAAAKRKHDNYTKRGHT